MHGGEKHEGSSSEIEEEASMKAARTFRYGHVDVVGALARMAKLTDSRWRTVESATGLGTLPELLEQLLEMRRVENTLGKKWCAVV